ncbi:peroxidase family protein [Kaarinaea lacus]
MKTILSLIFSPFVVVLLVHSNTVMADDDVKACIAMAKSGLRPIAEERSERFLGKVAETTARCRGGDKVLMYRETPWVDWSNYWSTGDGASKKEGAEAVTLIGEHLKPNGRGIDGALLDLEYQRIELIKFNLFDNYTYETYVKGTTDREGSVVKQWDEMRLSKDHPHYNDVGGSKDQICNGQFIRYRTLTGICNDIHNPKMGSTGTLFSRNVQFENTFPRLAKNDLAKNRHSDAENGMRLSLLKPDPQLISRKLFTRIQQSSNDTCNDGQGLADYSPQANCDYQPAPFFNVLAAFWIQFMTHDWFAHLDEGRNQVSLIKAGCESSEAQQAGCRSDDLVEAALIAQDGEPESFTYEGEKYLKRAYKTTKNNVTAWWDASQIYGYDDVSQQRVIRDPQDPAKLLQTDGYLPRFKPCNIESDQDCHVQPQWLGQEATAFPDNWSIGLSFYHNLFVREHNYIVARFRELQHQSPDLDSGLRNPDDPEKTITYKEVSDEELYQIARLIVSAEIAKIHTIEWTTQLLYGEPLYKGMNANWSGLFNENQGKDVTKVLRKILNQDESLFSRASEWMAALFGRSEQREKANSAYSVLASGSGIFGLGSQKVEGFLWWKHDAWDLANPDHVNGGVNHFGSPFNFPEEFTTVYRLHPLVPDLIEYREWQEPNKIKNKIPVIDTFRAGATEHMQSRGIENWALSMGRQRLGVLHLQNSPLFLQNLPMPHLNTPTKKMDVLALDILRDRERGVPRFNEFRRQIGLKSLRSFDDFVDQRLSADSPARQQQEQVVKIMRNIYGTHVCDASKIISDAQKNDQGDYIDDCLGHSNGSVVDNVEDVDTVVGWLAEYTRPHGFAISETQFHVFIINASRRLFSDRFFTSSFRPEFYSHFGVEWVNQNGLLQECPYPLQETDTNEKVCNEPEKSNGHIVQVSPLKRLLMRNIPELKPELMHVVNAFDPWARDRGEFYSLAWKPRKDARSDEAFANTTQQNNNVDIATNSRE